jgi:hypothetical protein
MSDEAPMTDEDRLIYQLTLHRDLVGWVIAKLTEAGIASQRTTGNDPKGDILIVAPNEASQVKEIIRDIHNQYNRENIKDSQSTVEGRETNLPHIEIKTTYLSGKAVNEIIDTATVIAVVSADQISGPGKAKFITAGIAYAENIPLNEFRDV